MTLVTSDGPPEPGENARAHFPFFTRGPAGSYLDSAATTQKPDVVLESLMDTMVNANANVHRGAYRLSALATELYDEARAKIARYIRAPDARSVVFVRGATEGINLVAYGSEHLYQEGDVILLTLLEHHSNIVPWQLLQKRRGVKLVFVDIHDDGRLNLDDYRQKVELYRPKLVAATQLANSLGTITPIEEMVAIAHAAGARILVDGAQGLSHLGVDVGRLGCDYYVFSGHKIYGPTAIGALYGRREALEALRPFQGGGDMISYVSIEGSGWAEIPERFEAGTPPFHEAIALGVAIDFIDRFSRLAINKHEQELVGHAIDLLKGEHGVTVHGPGATGGLQTSVVSFSIDGVHPHDFSTVADTHNVQVRAGHHCAQPTLRRLGLQSTARVSFGIYSCRSDLDALQAAIRESQALFRR